jgi:hypothetical protein
MTAIILNLASGFLVVEYDDDAHCISCGRRIGEGASVGGTAVCGACDCGRNCYNRRNVLAAYEKYGKTAPYHNVKHQTRFASKANAEAYLREFYPNSLWARLNAAQ